MPDSVVTLGFYVVWIGFVCLPVLLRWSVLRRMRRLEHPLVLHPQAWAPWRIGAWAISLGSMLWLRWVDEVVAYPWGFAVVLGAGVLLGYLGQFLVEFFTQRILVLGTTPAAVEDATRDALHFLKLEIRRKGGGWIVEDLACRIEVQKGKDPGTVDVQLHGGQGRFLLADMHALLEEDLEQQELFLEKKFPIPFPILALGALVALALGIGWSQRFFA